MRLGTLLALLSVAACGKSSSLVDAGPGGDGNGADAAATIDADAHGIVTVTVYDPDTGIVASGVQVAFIEPDGKTATEMMTDASGVASASVLPGASVTAGYIDHNALETVLGVKPGDHITINPYGPLGGTTKVGQFTVNVGDDGDTSYTVVGPCGAANPVVSAGSGQPTPVTIEIDSGCQESTMDLVVVGNNSDGVAEAWTHLPGVAYTDGGMVTIPATGWSPMETVSGTYSNVSTDDISNIELDVWVPDEDGWERDDSEPASATSTLSVANLPGATTAQFHTDFRGVGSSQDFFDVVDGTSTTYTVDASTELLPWVSAPMFDPSTTTVHIPMSAAAAGAAQYTDLVYQRTVNDATVAYYWELLSAPATDITLPQLPPDLAPFAPAAGDTPGANDAGVNDTTTIKTWDDARADAINVFDGYYSGRAPIGRMRASYSTTIVSDVARPAHRRHRRAPR